MKTIVTSVRIRLDQAIETEKRQMNVSKFLQEKLDEEFGTTDFIEKKEKELKAELKKLKDIKKENKEKIEKITDKEKRWLIETKKIIQERPDTFEPRRKSYMELFGKQINSKNFKDLLEKW